MILKNHNTVLPRKNFSKTASGLQAICVRFAFPGARGASSLRPSRVYFASVLRLSCVCGLAAASIAWLFASDLRVSEFEAVSYMNIYFKTPNVEGVHHKRDKIRTQTTGTRKHRKQNKILPRNMMTNLLSENNTWV